MIDLCVLYVVIMC